MGDPACWMHEVCPDCGAVSEERGATDPCPRCGAEADMDFATPSPTDSR